MPTRRQFLAGSAAALGLAGTGLPARAAAPTDRNLILLFARGGWENTRFLSPLPSGAEVYLTAGSTLAEAGGLTYVDHADRPLARTFFQTYGHRVGVLDGMLVRSVNHKVCERIVLTSSSKVGKPDWPSILGSAAADRFALPSVVLAGPTSPGPLERFSSVVGEVDQLQALLDGSVFSMGSQIVPPPPVSTTDLVEAALADRLGQRREGATEAAQAMVDAYDDALVRVERLKQDASLVAFAGAGPTEQAITAASMLQHGVARCLTIVAPGFDTHGNIEDQAGLSEILFDMLHILLTSLDTTPGRHGGTLADETIIAVVSEMGRAPYINGAGGKDHWPYTGAMLIGPGVQGGTRVGAYDTYLNGRPVDLARGTLDDAGVVLTPEHLGATLLTLCGVDPSAWVDVPPVEALLA